METLGGGVHPVADRSRYNYCPQYCEENVWHLCQEPQLDRTESKVVVISNEQKACALWHQRAALRSGLPVFWDYHVVLLSETKSWFVWDLDSTLRLPVIATQYLDKTFPTVPRESDKYRPMFRIIDAADYVAGFSSDRSHMRDKEGKWLAPPPPWPLILAGGPLSLSKLIDFRPRTSPECITLTRLHQVLRGL
jgi:protein N-terminal glutamine amidohydrolase